MAKTKSRPELDGKKWTFFLITSTRANSKRTASDFGSPRQEVGPSFIMLQSPEPARNSELFFFSVRAMKALQVIQKGTRRLGLHIMLAWLSATPSSVVQNSDKLPSGQPGQCLRHLSRSRNRSATTATRQPCVQRNSSINLIAPVPEKVIHIRSTMKGHPET